MPDNIDPTGQVTFTDGKTKGLIPNQETCLAYGFTYDQDSGTCRAFRLNTNLNQQFSAASNSNLGPKNLLELGTNYTRVNGVANEVQGQSNCGFVSGTNNEIYNSIDNASVVGQNGKATRPTEFVIGGGSNSLGYTSGEETIYQYVDRQMSVIHLSCVTTDNTTTRMTMNGDLTNYINIRPNSIVGYEIYITRLEVGGTSGTAGDYSYRNRKGCIQIDNSYNMDIDVGFTRNIAKVGGVNGTFTEVDVSTSDNKAWTIEVSDRNNVINVWSASIYLHETILTSVTF